MAPAESNEERAHRRQRVLSTIAVEELGVAEPIGVLEDLSLGGFRLGTPRVIAVGARKRLRIPLPAAYELGAALEFEAECRWLRANPKGPGFQCGFQFGTDCVERLQPELNAILRRLS
jgi:PilZ domain